MSALDGPNDMTTDTPRCHICGDEGESLLPWAQGGGEIRHCRDCDFVFAWPVEHIDPVDIYSPGAASRESLFSIASPASGELARSS